MLGVAGVTLPRLSMASDTSDSSAGPDGVASGEGAARGRTSAAGMHLLT